MAAWLTMPRANPPTTAPTIEVMPPSTTPVKAGIMNVLGDQPGGEALEHPGAEHAGQRAEGAGGAPGHGPHALDGHALELGGERVLGGGQQGHAGRAAEEGGQREGDAGQHGEDHDRVPVHDDVGAGQVGSRR